MGGDLLPNTAGIHSTRNIPELRGDWNWLENRGIRGNLLPNIAGIHGVRNLLGLSGA